MVKYRVLAHTADLRLEVFGSTPEDLFISAAEALGDILLPEVESKKFKVESLKEKISIESTNLNTLLVDFLNEILAKSHINKKVYKVKSLKLKENALEADITGYSAKKFDEDIKAVTYHGVDIRQTTNDKRQKVWRTELVLDI